MLIKLFNLSGDDSLRGVRMAFSLFKKKIITPKRDEMPPMFWEAASQDFSAQQAPGSPMQQVIPEPPDNYFMKQAQPPKKDSQIFDKFADDKFYPDTNFGFEAHKMPQAQKTPVQFPEKNDFSASPEPDFEMLKRFGQQEKSENEGIVPDLMTAETKKEIDTGKPIFIKVDKYRAILRELSNIKSIIKNANFSISALHSLKESEDSELEEWRSRIEDIERKLIYVDDSLFGSL